MSRHAQVEIEWGDRIHAFRLGLGELEELERKTNAGIFFIVSKMHPDIRTCRTTEISEILRLGLIGGGMSAVEAMTKVRKYMDEEPIDANRDVAYAVALASLMRMHGDKLHEEAVDPPPKKAAAKKRTDGSTSSPSPAPPT